jgi:hypothetical protein
MEKISVRNILPYRPLLCCHLDIFVKNEGVSKAGEIRRGHLEGTCKSEDKKQRLESQ